MTKKERLEQLEQDVADLRIEVDRLRTAKPYDPFQPNYYTCQVCFGKYQVGSYHFCGSGLPTYPYDGGWFNSPNISGGWGTGWYG
jgi:hypothetical protein